MKPIDYILICVLIVIIGVAVFAVRKKKHSCCGSCDSCKKRPHK